MSDTFAKCPQSRGNKWTQRMADDSLRNLDSRSTVRQSPEKSQREATLRQSRGWRQQSNMNLNSRLFVSHLNCIRLQEVGRMNFWIISQRWSNHLPRIRRRAVAARMKKVLAGTWMHFKQLRQLLSGSRAIFAYSTLCPQHKRKNTPPLLL